MIFFPSLEGSSWERERYGERMNFLGRKWIWENGRIEEKTRKGKNGKEKGKKGEGKWEEKCVRKQKKRFIYLLHIYYHVRRNKIRLQDKTNHENEIGVTH